MPERIAEPGPLSEVPTEDADGAVEHAVQFDGPIPGEFYELPDSIKDVSDKFLYAVAAREGGGILLTVFEGGGSSSAELSEAMVEQLIEQLRNRGRREL